MKNLLNGNSGGGGESKKLSSSGSVFKNKRKSTILNACISLPGDPFGEVK